MNRLTLSGLALTAYFCAIASASAAPSASSSVATGPITIILTDLDLTDGITPSVVFSPTVHIPNWTHIARASITMIHDGVADWRDLESAGQEPLVLSGTVDDRLAVYAAVTEREEFATYEITASSYASGSDGSLAAEAGGGSGFYDFVLSANTALTLQTTASMSGTINPVPGHSAYIRASASINMWVGSEEIYFSDRHGITLNSTTAPDTSANAQELISVTFENYGNSAITGFAEMGAQSIAHVAEWVPIPGIPEPGTLPMMAAGLGLIAMRTLRSRGRPAPGR